MRNSVEQILEMGSLYSVSGVQGSLYSVSEVQSTTKDEFLETYGDQNPSRTFERIEKLVKGRTHGNFRV